MAEPIKVDIYRFLGKVELKIILNINGEYKGIEVEKYEADG